MKIGNILKTFAAVKFLYNYATRQNIACDNYDDNHKTNGVIFYFVTV